MSYLNNNMKSDRYVCYKFKNDSHSKVFNNIYKYLIDKNYKEQEYFIKFLKKQQKN